MPHRPRFTLADWRRAARVCASPMAWRYFSAGADAQATLVENVRAWRRWQVWPRVFVDVSARSLATTVLGTPVSLPVLIAPTAYHKLAHPDGEPATARGAAAAGTIYCVSTLATTALEEVAAAADGPKWFQLYVHRDAGLTAQLVARAEAAGYRALVVTADTPVLGRRICDERHGFSLPPPLTMPNLEKDLPLERRGGSALAQWFADRHCASFTWRDLEKLRASTRLPVVVKGILRGDDAARAIELGCAGVIVSNHGGRQLDGVPATVDALRAVVDAVGGRGEIFVDGGIRWGGDVLKALALGARAVLLGRPILWGLGVAGADGVRDVLELMRAELSRAMALAGVVDVRDVPRDLVARRT